MSEPLLRLVDPELRAAAEAMRQGMTRFSPMTPAKLVERRAWIESMVAAPLADVPVTQRTAPGDPDAALLLVNARPRSRPVPGILHFHGGGYTAGSARASLRGVQELAAALDCVIASVDYRLAPETGWAGAAADGLAALRWLHAEGPAIGVDPGRLALVGESADGGHAVRVAALAAGEVPLALQLLLYPMLDDRTGSSRPVPPHIGAFGWNAEANRFGWACLLGHPAGEDAVAEGAVPSRFADLSGLPPTFIGVGALDLFVGECVDFAARLIDAGVPTEALVVPGAFHGFDMLAKDAGVSRRFTDAKLGALRRAFGL